MLAVPGVGIRRASLFRGDPSVSVLGVVGCEGDGEVVGVSWDYGLVVGPVSFVGMEGET